MPIFFLLFGVLGIYLFHEGIYPPIVVSASVLILSAGYVIWLYWKSQIGPLIMLLFVAYELPFIHIFPYIWFDFDAELPLILWGLVVNPYMTNKTIIELMSMIGAVGAAGFVTGILFIQRKPLTGPSNPMMSHYRALYRTLSLPVFCIWIAIAIILTWINAPVDTIFTAKYTESKPISDTWNFSSSWMISYAFLLFALADSMFESSVNIGPLKRKIVFLAVLFVVIWFQLLRGDRESLPCVISALLMYYVWGREVIRSEKDKIKIKVPVLLFALFAIALVSYLIGVLRTTATGIGSMSELLNTISELAEAGSIGYDGLLTGTWSAVLLTPLSVAGDYINGSLPLNYGQTYLDLIGSILPGFLADWIGYVRPIDSLRGPAWQMTYGAGGIHAVVVPFTDFRMAGVFMIVTLWSFAFVKMERLIIRHLNVSKLALLGIIGMAIPTWIWYGEKNIINAFIIWSILSIIYSVRLPHSDFNSIGKAYQTSKSFLGDQNSRPH